MKKVVCAGLALVLLSSPMAFAGGGHHGGKRGGHDRHHDGHHDGSRWGSRWGSDKYSGGETTRSVPEIDAAGAGVALALLAGLVAVRRERRAAK